MNNLAKKIGSVWPLRISFGLMYLYSGFDIATNPKAWTWALPQWFQKMIGVVMPVDLFLRFHGSFEVVMALVFLAWFMKPAVVKIFATLSALELAGILLLTFLPWKASIFFITFRDIGLLGGALALVALLFRNDASIPSIQAGTSEPHTDPLDASNLPPGVISGTV